MAQSATNGPHAKKKILYASERNREDVVEARARFCRRRLRWRQSNLVFVDESGVNLALTRANGWAPRGERLIDHVPGGRWEAFSVIAALRIDGVYAPMLLPGAVNTEVLRVWVRDHLAPELLPGDIVVWDNLSIHNDGEARAYIEARGARLEFLPPYSPDLNPIEPAWSKAKTLLRGIGPRTWRRLINSLGRVLDAITPTDSAGWFHHCGYTKP